MIESVELPRAFWRTIGMARKAGLDLPEAVVEGWLTRRDLARLVDGCTACRHHRTCLLWLAAPGEAPLPAYCRNKVEIESLHPGA